MLYKHSFPFLFPPAFNVFELGVYLKNRSLLPPTPARAQKWSDTSDIHALIRAVRNCQFETLWFTNDFQNFSTILSIMNHKEIENELHEQLYNNILVLAVKYPITKEFNEVFKKDMFHKNNKAAFQHIIHFLLSILDPVRFKQRISWPIYDNQMEIQFRNDVMKYVNEFPTIYEDSNIPLLTASHLISPGGYRFVNFIHSLSQFVLYEHLSREEDNVLFPLKPAYDSAHTTQGLNRLNSLTDDNINRAIRKQLKFKEEYSKYEECARNIVEQKWEVEQGIFGMKKEFRDFQCQLKEEISRENTLMFDESMKNLDKKIEELHFKETKFVRCKNLVETLIMNKNTLQYNNTSGKCVNLAELFKTLEDLLRKNRYLLSETKNIDFEQYLCKTEEIIDDLNILCNRYETFNTELLRFMSKMEDVIHDYEYKKIDDKNDIFYEVWKLYEPVPLDVNITNFYN